MSEILTSSVLTLLEKLILPWSTTIASYANWQPRMGSVTHGSCTGVGEDEVDHKTKVVARLGGGAGQADSSCTSREGSSGGLESKDVWRITDPA